VKTKIEGQNMVLRKYDLKSNEQNKPNENEFDVLGYVSETTKKLAPIILPMISYLADLEIEE